jgi:hypothetical protein
LRVSADLDDRASLDEGSDFFPSLAVFFEALEEETVFFGGPAAGVFGGGGIDFGTVVVVMVVVGEGNGGMMD